MNKALKSEKKRKLLHGNQLKITQSRAILVNLVPSG